MNQTDILRIAELAGLISVEWDGDRVVSAIGPHPGKIIHFATMVAETERKRVKIEIMQRLGQNDGQAS